MTIYHCEKNQVCQLLGNALNSTVGEMRLTISTVSEISRKKSKRGFLWNAQRNASETGKLFNFTRNASKIIKKHLRFF